MLFPNFRANKLNHNTLNILKQTGLTAKLLQ